MLSVLDGIEEEEGPEVREKIELGIHEVIIKSLCLAVPHIKHLVKSCQPDEIENSMCYQVLGFDIIIDSKFVPLLLEINQMPSFATGSPLDYKLKYNIIADTLKLLCMSP